MKEYFLLIFRFSKYSFSPILNLGVPNRSLIFTKKGTFPSLIMTFNIGVRYWFILIVVIKCYQTPDEPLRILTKQKIKRYMSQTPKNKDIYCNQN